MTPNRFRPAPSMRVDELCESRDETPNPFSPLVSQDLMNGETLRRKVVVTNPHGFHMRPAAEFAKRADRFQSSVTLAKDELRINGKSLLELFLLVALPGTELWIEVSGPDAEEALDDLAQLLAAPSVEASAAQTAAPLPQKG